MAVTEIRSARAEGYLILIIETRPFTDAESYEVCVVHSSICILPAVHQHRQ